MKKVKTENTKILFRAFSYLIPLRYDVILVLIFMIFSSCINLAMPLLGQKIMDNGLVQKNITIVVENSIIILILVIMDRCTSFLETKFYTRINNKFQFSLFKDAFKKMLRFHQDYFSTTNYSEIVSNISTDINNVSKITDYSTFILISQVFKFIIGIIGLLIINWQLTLIVLLIAPIKYFFMKVITKSRQQTVEDFIESNRKFYSWFGEIINGIKEIKLWSLQDITYHKFVQKQRDIITSNTKLAYLDNINQSADFFLFQLITCILYVLGGIFLTHNSITIGGIYALLSYSTYVTNPISAVINLRYNYASVIPSAKRIFKFFDNKAENIYTVNQKSVCIDCKNVKGSIVFKNVSFKYTDKPVLSDVSFEIMQGEKVAILGENGSGKTTILDLILRFIVPDSGNIFLDGIDVNTIRLYDYRNAFSVVCQDPYIFNATIKENVDLAQNHTDAEIENACIKSKANDFINKLPNKYNSLSGRNGSVFSGGERQKIAVARAFINQSPVVIFDEATSSFDTSSDDYLNQTIFNELKDKTVIVITHKPSITKYMDKVLVINDGTVSEISIDQSAVGSI